MSKIELLTVKEVADFAGVSVQSIYTRLEKDFKPYLKIENGKKRLDSKVLELFQRPNTKEDFKYFLNLLEKQNETLNKELEIKNSQIEELNQRLKEAHKIISQAQQLHKVDKVLELQEANEQMEVVTDSVLSEVKSNKEWWKFWKL